MGKYWKPLEKLSTWRRISVGMWETPRDPSIYGHETIDMTETLPYLEEVGQAVGEKISPAALLVYGFASLFAERPELNVMIVNGRIQQRQSVDAFCQVAIPSESEGTTDLSGVKLKRVDQLDLVEINRALKRRAEKVRAGQDHEIEQTKKTIDVVPPQLMKYMLRAVDVLTYNVPFDLDAIGVRSDPFGSFMVSSIASFDLRLGYAPLVPASRCPIVALPGKVHDVVMPVDGVPKVVPGMIVGCTFDHRCYDGAQIGVIVRRMRDVLAHPRTYLPAPAHWAGQADAAESRRPEDVARIRPPR